MYINGHFRYTNVLMLLCFCFKVDKSNQKYLVNNEKCKIPKYEPFHPESLKIWMHKSYRACADRPLLTYVTKTDDEAILHIKEHLLPLYGQNVSCCKSNVVRISDDAYPDDNIRASYCINFNKYVKLNSDIIYVNCVDGRGYQVYGNVHMVVLRNKHNKNKMRSTLNTKPISVLFVVIDSVSRLNFIRTMPKTRDYLLWNDFIEMNGYNKVDDNTYPNFLAFLNGMNKQQYEKIYCTGRNMNELDDCPMIWYTFRDLGYVTAYGEDWGYLGTFNHMRKGFTKPPTDYYLRPYVMSSERLGTTLLHNAPYCAGPETSGERQLNVALDFAKTLKGTPYFGVFWMNTFSHQAINTPLRFDDKLRTFFTDLKAEGVLDDSIVILLSDHGIRLDPPIRKTLAGWFEERLPMNLISIPKWFREKYGKEYRNLLSNSKKLTSTYDLYMTLQHILTLSTSSYKGAPSQACPECVSLFEEVPERTCSQAGIPASWCTCIGYLTPVNASSVIVKKGVEFVLNHMRSELTTQNVTHLCRTIELSHVKSAGVSESKYLFMNFGTEPFGDYIVTLKYDIQRNNTIFTILFEITRLDRIPAQCYYFSKYCNCEL